MQVEISIELDHLYPNDIIELHRSGIISLAEIAATDCIHKEFGDILKDYVSLQKYKDLGITKVTG